MTWTAEEQSRMHPDVLALMADERHFKRYPVEVVCSGCSGRGCALCVEPEPARMSRLALLRRLFRRSPK